MHVHISQKNSVIISESNVNSHHSAIAAISQVRYFVFCGGNDSEGNYIHCKKVGCVYRKILAAVVARLIL